jgi:plastocyanin
MTPGPVPESARKLAHLHAASILARTGTPRNEKTIVVTLKNGRYTFVCDPHFTSMKGSFTVG